MSAFFFPLKRFWRYLKGSITFIPSIWVLGAIFCAITFRYLEGTGLSNWLGDRSDFWIISDPETARTILSTVIGGVISLTVFSFSMVMVVLGQATNGLSPRLLPQLIRDRSHQTVLGVYLAVIVFSCLALMADNPGDEYTSNPFTIFCCVLLMIICLGFFVYFISSISQRIQVGEVVRDIHRKAIKDMEHWRQGVSGWSVRSLPDEVNNWFPILATRSGYVDITIYEELSRLAGELSTKLFLTTPRNAYVQEGTTLFRSERPLSTAELEQVGKYINLNTDRDGALYYLTAMNYIREVVIKALSPGINDPGTAVASINLLGDLFYRMLQLPEYALYRKAEDGCGDVFLATVSFTDHLHHICQSIRTYAKSDPEVLAAILKMLEVLRHATMRRDLIEALEKEKAALREDGEQHLKNSFDRTEFLGRFH